MDPGWPQLVTKGDRVSDQTGMLPSGTNAELDNGCHQGLSLGWEAGFGRTGLGGAQHRRSRPPSPSSPGAHRWTVTQKAARPQGLCHQGAELGFEHVPSRSWAGCPVHAGGFWGAVPFLGMQTSLPLEFQRKKNKEKERKENRRVLSASPPLPSLPFPSSASPFLSLLLFFVHLPTPRPPPRCISYLLLSLALSLPLSLLVSVSLSLSPPLLPSPPP